jgi:hypothetical protein
MATRPINAEGRSTMPSAPLKRVSPVALPGRPARTEDLHGWPVVLSYAEEGEGPWVVDLSHRPRWDLQDANLDERRPLGRAIPKAPGEVHLEAGLTLNRLNATQAHLWHLAGDWPAPPDDPAVTDITEATLCLALLGPPVFRIAEKLTALDLAAPGRTAPRLVQGPLAHVPCQMVVFPGAAAPPALVFTCSRGYGHDMLHAVLAAGAEFALRPAGQEIFARALAAHNR